jgi:hypothetical protein
MRSERGRRYNCGCGKKRYRDEPAALDAAAHDEDTYGGLVTVYRCPGGLAWHLTSQGFRPEALRTVGRRLACELVLHDEVDLDDFRRRVLRLDGRAEHRKWRRAEQCAAEMREAGLVREQRSAGADGPGTLVALDSDGLRRVVQIGLDGYLAEVRPPGPR